VIPELERLLSLHVDDSLARRPLDELRRLCRESQDWETAVSLTRRLAQGRLDVLAYEARRRDGTAPDGVDAPQLLFDLPEILADPHGGSTGRALPLHPPGHHGDALAELLDAAADPIALCHPQDLADADLPDLHTHLVAFEAELSSLRRSLHQQLDALRAEIGRRYRTGEATVESVLR
jgi:hypothetical protein